MESDAKYALVGAVVVALTVAVVAAILWLADDGLTKDSQDYVVFFEKHSLSGLQVDGWVTMRGIKVGTVESIEISSENIEQLRVVLRLDAGTPVKTDSRAVVRRNLLTGLAWVDITESTQDAPLLLAQPRLSPEGLPIIPEGQAELEAIADSIPGVMEDVGEIAQRVNSFLSEDNREAVSRILHNIETFTATLAKNEQAITELVNNMSQMSEEMARFSKSWSRVANEADATIDSVSEELRLALKDARDAIDKIDDEVVVVARAVRNTADVISAEATSVSTAISDAARGIARVADEFENPKAAIFGPAEQALGPGERPVR